LFIFFPLEEVIGLKNFEISFTSLGNLARIGGGSLLMLASLSFILFLPVLHQVDIRGKFESYFLSEQIVVLVSKKQVLS